MFRNVFQIVQLIAVFHGGFEEKPKEEASTIPIIRAKK